MSDYWNHENEHQEPSSLNYDLKPSSSKITKSSDKEESINSTKPVTKPPLITEEEAEKQELKQKKLDESRKNVPLINPNYLITPLTEEEEKEKEKQELENEKRSQNWQQWLSDYFEKQKKELITLIFIFLYKYLGTSFRR